MPHVRTERSYALRRTHGSAAPSHPTDVVGLALTLNGTGYWLLAAHGAVYPFGSAAHVTDPILWPDAPPPPAGQFVFPLADNALPPAQAFCLGRVDQGQDFQTINGTPVVAMTDGTVTYQAPADGWGNHFTVIRMDTPFMGNPYMYYGHLTASNVNIGDRVRQGQVIGTAGGAATSLPGHVEVGFASNSNGDRNGTVVACADASQQGLEMHGVLNQLKPNLIPNDPCAGGNESPSGCR